MEPVYTQAIHDRIVLLFKAGVFKIHVAHACGLTEPELDIWLERGRKSAVREPWTRLARDVDRAIAEDAIRNQTTISRAATGRAGPAGDWKAAAWNLERKHPRLYGKLAGTLRELEAGEQPRSPFPKLASL